MLLLANAFPSQNELHQKVAAPILELVGRGQREGTIRDDVPVEVLADALLRLIAGGTYAGSVSRHGREDVASWACRVFLEGAAR